MWGEGVMAASTTGSTALGSGFECELQQGSMMSVPAYWMRTCLLTERGYTEVRGP